MIRSVDITAASDGKKPAPSAPAQTGKRFAEMLKTTAAASAPAGADLTAAEAPHYRFPDGETWKPVAGHRDYAQIVSGPRKGLFINLTLNERHGEAFSIQQRGGKTVHVYDIGGTETVVPAGNGPKHRHRHAAHSADTPPAGETWAPISGQSNYADILNGPRNGLYVNTQGGTREGMAFEIRKIHGRTFHIYGSGPKRLMVEIIPYVHKHQDSSSSDTGGVSAGAGSPAATTVASTGATAADVSGGVTAPGA